MEACWHVPNPVIMGPVDVKGLGGGKHHLSSRTRKIGTKGRGHILKREKGLEELLSDCAKSSSKGRGNL